jgi:eukaryotic-like serine/threonine-protein kinase
MSLLQEGQRIGATYVVERFLGEGAFAEVYRVRHRFLGRQAMKVFKTVGMTIEETEKLLAEALLLSRIGHPNIIRVFDANTTETSRGICGFFTMEYIAGGSLEQFWRSHGANFVPVETALEIVRQVCRGLAVAHSENPPIVHRDIKPQNILIGYDGSGLRAHVSDFGLAKRVNPMTLLASARGTPNFKPPEAFREIESDSCAGDVWAIGTTLYLLLTDQLPYPDVTEFGVHGKSPKHVVTPPSRHNLRVDPALDRITLRALAFRREDRYQSARELLTQLERFQPRSSTEAVESKQSMSSSDSLKGALGPHSPADELKAGEMARQALALAREGAKLAEAADLMEQALNKWPELRQAHEYRLKLWRRGIVS